MAPNAMALGRQDDVCISAGRSPPPPMVFDILRRVEGEVMHTHPVFSSTFYRTLLKTVLENEEKAKNIMATIVQDGTGWSSSLSAESAMVVRHHTERRTVSWIDPAYLAFVSLVAAAAILEGGYLAPEKQTVESHASVETDDVTVALSSCDDREKEISSLARKVKKYRKKNKELSDDFALQRRALLELESNYDILKLQLAEVRADEDANLAAAQEHMLEQDLQLMDLVHEKNVLAENLKKTASERETALEIAMELDKGIVDRDIQLLELANERDKLAMELKKSSTERDDACQKLEKLKNEHASLKPTNNIISNKGDETINKLHQIGHAEAPEHHDRREGQGPNAATRWVKKRGLLRLPRRARRSSEDVKITPVDFTATES